MDYQALNYIELNIHIVIQVRNQSLWLLSVIYGCPRLRERKFSKKIFLISLIFTILPSLGDFNDILFSHEKMGDRSIDNNRDTSLKNCLDSYGMVDFGFFEPSFTWSNS